MLRNCLKIAQTRWGARTVFADIGYNIIHIVNGCRSNTLLPGNRGHLDVLLKLSIFSLSQFRIGLVCCIANDLSRCEHSSHNLSSEVSGIRARCRSGISLGTVLSMSKVILTSNINHAISVGVVVAFVPSLTSTLCSRLEVCIVQSISSGAVVTKTLIKFVLSISIILGTILSGHIINSIRINSHKVSLEVVISSLREANSAH